MKEYILTLFSPLVFVLFFTYHRRGAAELAEYWMQLGNDDLRDFLEQGTAANDEFGNSIEGLEGGTERPFPSGEQLVAAALFRRLQHTIPHLRSWPQAMALGLYPGMFSSFSLFLFLFLFAFTDLL